MDYDKGSRTVFGLTAVYRCIYSNEKNQIACERFERFRKSRNSRWSQDDKAPDRAINVRSLKHETLLCPVSMTYPMHIGESARMLTNAREDARTLPVATPSMHRILPRIVL